MSQAPVIISRQRASFLADLLICAVEGGIQYWAEVTAYSWATPTPAGSGAEPIATAATCATLYATDEPALELVATIATMAHGLQILTTGGNIGRSAATSGPQYWEQFRNVCARSDGAEGDYDADIADNILQAGLFGEIVYG